MSRFSEQMQQKGDEKAHDRVRREKLASFFYNLAQLSFAALVLGSVMPILTESIAAVNVVTLSVGSISTYGFAAVANRILKK